MKLRFFFFLILFSNTLLGQCPTCGGVTAQNSGASGNWDIYSTWSGIISTGWTGAILGNRCETILNGHSVTVPASPTVACLSKNVLINSGGTLTLNGVLNGNSSSATIISVSGTLNVNAGNSNFDGATLTVCSGGVVNINGGQLKVSSIVVENGGVINIAGNGELARTNLSTGLNLKLGGVININSTNAKLSDAGLIGTLASTIDGTLDCKNSMTSSNQGNVKLGNVVVTNNTSTGRIRTQTAFLPSHDLTVPTTFANRFFGSNADYGGTVEYYGGANIALNSLWSRYYYYDLEINTPVTLIKETYVRGTLKLSGGNLTLNGQKLNIIGTISYSNSKYIVGDANARIEFRGKLSTNSLVSPGMTTHLINSFGVANVETLNPQLRMSSSTLGVATLKSLTINREDVVYVDYSRITMDSLHLKKGIFRTSDSEQSHIYVQTSDSLSVRHNTTGSLSNTSYVSGFLKRKVAIGKTFDFPVGYVNMTTWSTPATCADAISTSSSSSSDKHRRISFEVNNMGVATQDLAVRFYHPIDDECVGQLTATQFGELLDGIHPEGYWLSVPSSTASSVDYNTRLYIQGFSGLTDNAFFTIKRPENMTGQCPPWSTYDLPIPGLSLPGRIVSTDGSVSCIQNGYGKRFNHTEFSHHAIAYNSTPLSVSLFDFDWNCADQLYLNWSTSNEKNNDFFILEYSEDGKLFQYEATIDGHGTTSELSHYSYQTSSLKNGYYRLLQYDFDGRINILKTIDVNCEQQERLVVFPNPTQQNLQILMKDVIKDGNASLQLINMQGSILMNKPLTKQVMDLNLDGIERGTYLLKVTIDENVYLEKIIKQ